MAFVTLVIGNLGLILSNRSMTHRALRVLIRPNRALVFVVVTTILALTLAVFVPWLQDLFGFAPLGWSRLAEAVAAALACIVVNDVIGIVWRWVDQRRAATGAKAVQSRAAA